MTLTLTLIRTLTLTLTLTLALTLTLTLAQARATVAAAVARGEIEPDTIEVIEGFSTAITLPEPADLLVAEISGSVATEEGMCHSIRDARLRHMARPNPNPTLTLTPTLT